MPSTSGERLIGNTISDIAPNHVSRYEWAARTLKKLLPDGGKILDAACGCGYGSWILANQGFDVECFDISAEAEMFQQNFTHKNVKFRRDDIMNINDGKRTYDAVVSIETIEHVPSVAWIEHVGRMTSLMMGTVPNQDVVPFNIEKYPWHHRHFTKSEVVDLMDGWELSDWNTQYAKFENFEMRPGDDGMTLGWIGRK
jgi:protein-L-isoaspartate O-methyltransferase